MRRPGAEAKDNTPPLPADQLTHAVDCFRKLKQQKPDWATGTVAQAVMAELKRAKVTYEEFADKATVAGKLSRNTAPAAFFVASLVAIDAEVVKLEISSGQFANA